MKKGWILLLISILIISCKQSAVLSMKDFDNKDVFDLSLLCDEPYDFLLIVDEGYYLSDFDLSSLKLEVSHKELYQWCGEKIYFISNKKIINQVHVDYYVSEPKEHYGYVSFFPVGTSSNNYIYRDYNNSVFYRKTVQKLNYDSYCYYLE